tara:strand:- start:2714 stop:3550 length:837 start_codon:yes stop_codon:yes gene_type:complete
MADYEKHHSLNVNHSQTEDTDMTIQVMNPAVRSNTREGQFGPQTKYPVDVTINEISSIGGAHVWDGSRQVEPQTETIYTWWVPENTFKKIESKDCNSAKSTFIISRPATPEPKDSSISILRATSDGPNSQISENSDSAPTDATSSNTGNSQSNGQPNRTTAQAQPRDSAEELLNILGVGVECYVLTDLFLNSERIKEINERRELVYDVQDYLKLFQYFQFKFKDGTGRINAPHLDKFSDGFENVEDAVREATQAAEEAENVNQEPVPADNATDDDLPF